MKRTIFALVAILLCVSVVRPSPALPSPQIHRRKTASGPRATVTLLGFSDYHSHVLPFYSEGKAAQGGLARALGYLKREKSRGALVFSGGDMINKGSPAWSDKFHCAEWSWLNGVVDAMAFGNHDSDYGGGEFSRCRGGVRYPILSANTDGFQGYDVFNRQGIRIGVFAVAGPDFPSLVKTPGFRYSDRITSVRRIVKIMREEEHADAVVLIGHEHLDDDFALARAVPGIDVILGSHSHLKREWQQIPGTSTWFLSTFQYLTYIGRVELSFEGHTLKSARGSLVPVDARMPSDQMTKRRVEMMERELERDPQYADLFTIVAHLDRSMSVEELGAVAVQAMRSATGADIAVSTKTSFRQPLPAGSMTMELLRMAMPYDNEIVMATMSGQELLTMLGSRAEASSYVAGTIESGRTYRVAMTDYLAGLSKLNVEKMGLHVRDEVRKALR